jgi:type IV secretion system protein VirB3
MQDDPGIVQVPLAVALTRPSSKWGVPYEALVVNLVVSVLAMIGTHNLSWLSICVPIHAVCYLVCLKDPRSFELVWLWVCTTLRTLLRTRYYWSGSSYSPLLLRPPPSALDLRHQRVRRRVRQLLENYHANH